jgi:hypothetical protein
MSSIFHYTLVQERVDTVVLSFQWNIIAHIKGAGLKADKGLFIYPAIQIRHLLEASNLYRLFLFIYLKTLGTKNGKYL